MKLYGKSSFVNPEKARHTVLCKLEQDPGYYEKRLLKSKATCRKKYGVDYAQ